MSREFALPLLLVMTAVSIGLALAYGRAVRAGAEGQTRRRVIGLLGFVVAALAVGIAARVMSPRAIAPAAPCVAADTPGGFDPACDRDPSVSEGPGSTRLRMAVSADGVRWAALPGTLAHQAGVPSCLTVGGTLHVFFVAYRDATGRVHDSAVHAQTLDLRTWIFDEVRPDRVPEGFRDDLLDPTVLAVDGGYVLLATQGSTGTAPARIFRYGSPDLDRWRFEAAPGSPGGSFWGDPERKMLDSAGFRTASGDFLLLASGDLKRGHFSARWNPAEAAPIAGPRVLSVDRGQPVKLTNCAPEASGAACFGYTTQPPFALRRAHVSDAGEVTVDPEPLLAADRDSGGLLADPAVCPLPDGQGQLMIYVSGYPR